MSVPLPDKQPTVLLIDDSVEILRLLEVRLRADNVHLITTTNGLDGLRIATERRPALILLDLDMPMMDGFEVLRELKDNASTANIPVIVISGSADTVDKVAGFDLGAVDYVCKPFNMPELRARMRSALRIHQLMQLLAQRAQIDGLTGLWNRAYFDDRLAEEVAGHLRTKRPFSLVMCDLDLFKSLNDTHGHPAGDAALQGFATQMLSVLRKEDVACRYGGEEFALILRETDATQACALVERLRVMLESTRWALHPERTITASFGVCDFALGDPALPENWLKNADNAMYYAKKHGRNKVHNAADTEPNAPLAKAG